MDVDDPRWWTGKLTAPFLKGALPDETWKVAEIKDYLDANGIDYSKSATKSELLALIGGDVIG